MSSRYTGKWPMVSVSRVVCVQTDCCLDQYLSASIECMYTVIIHYWFIVALVQYHNARTCSPCKTAHQNIASKRDDHLPVNINNLSLATINKKTTIFTVYLTPYTPSHLTSHTPSHLTHPHISHTLTSHTPSHLTHPHPHTHTHTPTHAGWYEGERLRDLRKGWFPSNFCVEIENLHTRARNLRETHRLRYLTESVQSRAHTTSKS